MEFFGFRTQKWRAPADEQGIAALRKNQKIFDDPHRSAEIKHEQHAPPPPPEEASEVSLTSASEVEADADAHAIDLNMLTAPKACSSESEDAGDTTDSTRTPVLTGRREQVQKTDLGEQVYFDLADILANGRSDSEAGAQTPAELQLEKNAGAQEGTSAVAADPLPPEGQCGVGGEEKGNENGAGEEMEIGMEKVETGEVIELERSADEHDEIEKGAGAVAKVGEQDEGMGEVISSGDVARQRLLEVLISQYGEEGAAAAMKQIFAEDAEDEAEGGEAGEMVLGNQHLQGTSNGASDHDRELYGEEANAMELDFHSPTGNAGDALPEGGGYDLGCEGGPAHDQMVGLFPAAEEKGTTSAPHQQHSFSLLHMLQGGSDVVEDGAAAEDQEGRVETQEWKKNGEEHYDAVEISDYYGTNERETSEHFDETSYQAFLAQHYGYQSQWGDHSGTTWAAGYDQEQDHRQDQFQYPPPAAAVTTATNATGNAPPAEAKNGDEGPPVVAAGSKPKTSFPDPTKQEELARKLQSLIAQVKSGGNSSSGEEETSVDQQQPQNNGALPSGAVVAGSGTSFADHSSYYAAQSKGQQKGAHQQMRAAAHHLHDTQQLSNSFAPHQQQLRSRKGLGKSRGGKGEGPARQQAPLHPLLRPLPSNASAKMRAQHAAAAAALSQVEGHGQQNAWPGSSRQMQANYATPADARGYNHGNINQSHRAGRHQPGGNTNLVAQYQSYLARSQGRERGSGHPRGGGGGHAPGQHRGGQHRGGRNRPRHNPGQGAGRAMGQGMTMPQGMLYSWGNAGYGNQNHGYNDVGSTGARSASSSFQPGPRMPGKGNEGARASGAAEGQEKHEGKKEVDHLVKMAKELLGILGQNEAEA
eukprot:g11163.t1